MKGEFYRMEYEAWDEGTDELTLEQEAAYLRLCHQMYRRRGEIPATPATLARIWRCHPNKARKILEALVSAGKVEQTPEGLINNRVRQELDQRGITSTRRSDAGKTGGTRSGEVRRNVLKGNDHDEANASTHSMREEKEKSRGEENTRAAARPSDWPEDFEEQFGRAYPRSAGSPVRIGQKLAGLRDEGVRFGMLLDAARSYAASTEARFVCNADRWLAECRWRNEPAFKAGGAAATVPTVFVARDSPEGEAWSRHDPRLKWFQTGAGGVAGRSMPSQWPPGWAPIAEAAE